MSKGPLRTITFTQGHPDHVGGWSSFNQLWRRTRLPRPIIRDVREYWRHLHPFYVRRIMTLWGAFMDVESRLPHSPRSPCSPRRSSTPTLFELGRSLYRAVLSTPGGETTDALAVWLPEQRIVFIGNLMGPFFGHVPNLYTLRGDKIRSAMAFIHSVDRVIALSPRNAVQRPRRLPRADEIEATMTKVRDATEYLRDRTIDGMNSGADLWTLMRDITLPSELALPQVHGRCRGSCGRSGRSTSGGFATSRPPSSTTFHRRPSGLDVVELVGGTGPLIERADTHARGRTTASDAASHRHRAGSFTR